MNNISSRLGAIGVENASEMVDLIIEQNQEKIDSLRHSMEQRLSEHYDPARVRDRVAAAVLGSDARLTQRYTHRVSSAMRQAVALLDGNRQTILGNPWATEARMQTSPDATAHSRYAELCLE